MGNKKWLEEIFAKVKENESFFDNDADNTLLILAHNGKRGLQAIIGDCKKMSSTIINGMKQLKREERLIIFYSALLAIQDCKDIDEKLLTKYMEFVFNDLPKH